MSHHQGVLVATERTYKLMVQDSPGHPTGIGIPSCHDIANYYDRKSVVKNSPSAETFETFVVESSGSKLEIRPVPHTEVVRTGIFASVGEIACRPFLASLDFEPVTFTPAVVHA